MQSSLNEYELLQNQVNLEIAKFEEQLTLALGSNEPLTTADSLYLLPHATVNDLNSLQIQLAKQNIQIEQAGIDLIKMETKPDFNVDYALQKYFEGGWLHGLQAGVQIPLFKKQVRQRISASKLQVETANLELETVRLKANQNLLSVESSIELYAAGRGALSQSIGKHQSRN